MPGRFRISAALSVAIAAVALAGCGSGDEAAGRSEVTAVEAGTAPEYLAYGFGALWVTVNGGVVRLDPESGERQKVELGDAASAPVAAGEGAVWASKESSVVRIDPATRRAGDALELAPPENDLSDVGSIATGDGRVWAAAENKLFEIDPRSGQLRGEPIVIGGSAKRAVVAGETVWVLLAVGFEPSGPSPSGLPDSESLRSNDNTLVQVDPRTRKVVRRLKVGESPADLAAGAGSIWVVDFAGGGLRRLDPEDGRETGRATEVSGNFLAVDKSGVWVSDTRANKVGRFEPKTGRLSAGPFVIPVDGSENSAEVGELALGAGSTWVASPIGPKIGRIKP